MSKLCAAGDPAQGLTLSRATHNETQIQALKVASAEYAEPFSSRCCLLPLNSWQTPPLEPGPSILTHAAPALRITGA